jgi:sugar phosphate isomerase/epimerase
MEVGDWWFDFYAAKTEEMMHLAAELGEFDLELVGLNCLRKCVTHPAVAEKNRDDLRRAVEVAAAVKARFVNVSLSLIPSVSGVAEDRIKGLQVSPGGGMGASEAEFADAAGFLGGGGRGGRRRGGDRVTSLQSRRYEPTDLAHPGAGQPFQSERQP